MFLVRLDLIQAIPYKYYWADSFFLDKVFFIIFDENKDVNSFIKAYAKEKYKNKNKKYNANINK